MRALILAALLCLPVAPAGLRAADDVSVEALRRDDALEVVCKAILEAPLELIWQTLTDYDRLSEFIPGGTYVGPMTPPPEEPAGEYPYTLDLRRKP